MQIMNPSDCIRMIDRVVTTAGEISENASSKYLGLLNQIKALKREISISMESLTKSYAEQGVLQEKYSDIRDGRFVLPVKISDQSKVEGKIAEFFS